MRVRFVESVYQDGQNYQKGREYDVSKETAAAPGSSIVAVVVIEVVKPKAEAKRKSEDQESPKEPEAEIERKDVTVSPKDKMVKAAPARK